MEELDRQNLDSELYVAEYCFFQKCFHHSFLKSSMETNLKSIKKLMAIKDPKAREEMVFKLSWIPFSIGTYEETGKDIDAMRDYMESIGWKDLGLIG